MNEWFRNINLNPAVTIALQELPRRASTAFAQTSWWYPLGIHCSGVSDANAKLRGVLVVCYTGVSRLAPFSGRVRR